MGLLREASGVQSTAHHVIHFQSYISANDLETTAHQTIQSL
jgi:hypothetical protein